MWLVCDWASVLMCQDLVVVGMLVVCFRDYTSECKLVCTGFVCVCHYNVELIQSAYMVASVTVQQYRVLVLYYTRPLPENPSSLHGCHS